MISKSPSGALCPYYYKGGYFHGIHYESYFDDMNSFLDMVGKEEEFILKKSEKRRILMDLYETNIINDKVALIKFVEHIEHISDRIFKLAISTDKRSLNIIKKAIKKANIIPDGCVYYCPDMETAKTWLVSDNFKAE